MHRRTDKRTTYENGKPVDNFTKVPNELINHLGLTANQKLVLIKHVSEQFKTRAKPDSERKASKSLRLSRGTYSDATVELQELGVLEPHGKGGSRKQEAYTVHLERLSSLPDRPSTGSNGVPVGRRPNRQTGPIQSQSAGSNGVPVSAKLAQTEYHAEEQRRQTQEHRSAALNGSSLTDVSVEGMDGDAVDGVVQPACPAASPSEASTKGKGISEPEARLPASEGPQASRPARPWTNAELNAGFVRPDGYRASDDFDDLDCDLNNVLAMLYGEPLNRGTLDKLAAKHEVRRCALWAHWLPRKIASMYATKPVAKPTALYVCAVEEGWQVDSKWPEFDEMRHTAAAREEYHKRMEARRNQDRRPEATDDHSNNNAPSEDFDDEFEQLFDGAPSPAVNSGHDDDGFGF